MKIGMILDNEFTGDLRVENEITALQKAGHQVFLLCLNFGGKKDYEEFGGAKIFRIGISLQVKKKLAGLNNTLFNFYPYFWAYHIKKFVKEHGLEVLHVHDLWLLNGALKANKKLRLPLVADLHENFVDALSHYKYANKFPNNILISKKKWARSEKEWCKKADRLITVIEEAVERYVNIGVREDKIFVVPNYVNLSSFHINGFDEKILRKYEKYFTLVYTGGFDGHRGLETVIKAAALLKGKIEKFKVVLVGSGSNFNDLKALAEELKVNDVVSFEGWQPPDKLPSYIKAADMGLIPHLKTTHTDNTIPHKLFQYMLLEKPVIATDCKPLKRIITETNVGLIFPSGNAEKLSEKVLELFLDSTRRKQMGIAGKKAVQEKYNWEKAAENLIALYKGLGREN